MNLWTILTQRKNRYSLQTIFTPRHKQIPVLCTFYIDKACNYANHKKSNNSEKREL